MPARVAKWATIPGGGVQVPTPGGGVQLPTVREASAAWFDLMPVDQIANNGAEHVIADADERLKGWLPLGIYDASEGGASLLVTDGGWLTTAQDGVLIVNARYAAYDTDFNALTDPVNFSLMAWPPGVIPTADNALVSFAPGQAQGNNAVAMPIDFRVVPRGCKLGVQWRAYSLTVPAVGDLVWSRFSILFIGSHAGA